MLGRSFYLETLNKNFKNKINFKRTKRCRNESKKVVEASVFGRTTRDVDGGGGSKRWKVELK